MAEKAGVAGYDKAQWQKKPPRKASVGPEQPMMAALRAEHRHIASVMELMAGQLDAIERGELSAERFENYRAMGREAAWNELSYHEKRQKDRAFGDDAARVALLKLFDMLGDEPSVNRYRARMFNLLH